MEREEFQMRFGKQLNAQQQKAVYAVPGQVLLLAVPGSGKTTVLVTRLGYMVCCAGIDPRSILTMTFTTAAAAEMRERFGRLFGRNYADTMMFCTINSLCSRIIRYVGAQTGKEPFSLISEADAASLVRQIYQSINHEFATENVVKDVRAAITYIKNMSLTDEQIEERKFGIDHMPQIYREYNETLRAARQMDFDDQLVYAYNILKNFPTVLESYRNRYPYICVDEAQDTSKLQHEIISMLAGKNGNLFMVGDEDQSIYGFRGAYPAALLNFKTQYPDALILTMEENYRSCEPIIQIANRFIGENTFRYQKQIVATRGPGKNVGIIPLVSREEQYPYLLDRVRDCQQETAVLFRNNDSALPLIDLLERNGIPYANTKKEMGFFTHRIITDLRDIIYFADHPYHTELFMNIYYKVGLRITKEMALYACSESSRTGQTILDVLTEDGEIPAYVKENVRNLEEVLSHIDDRPPYGVLGEIWNTLDYRSYVALRNMDAGKYQIMRILAKQERTCKELLDRLAQLEQIISEHVNGGPNRLILSTIHSSKGLEYERVYLLDVLDGILPLESGDDIEDVMQHEEDRRVCYVGITRAKKELYVFDCKGCQSQFVDDMKCYMGLKTRSAPKPSLRIKADFLEKKKEPPQKLTAKPGSRIVHKTLGPGVIQVVRGDMVSIWLEKTGQTKVFSWKKILEEHLLEI